MKKIWITLDDDTAAWARVRAAERKMSLSCYVIEVLRESMRRSFEYQEGIRRFLTQRPIKLKGARQRYLKRAQANERARLRRR